MSTLLQPGRNCSHVATARECGVLIDARDYYLAVHAAVQQAHRYVLIAGWQFDSEVPLLRGADAQHAAGPVRLLPLLERATADKPELEVYLLAWDYSLVFALEREWMQRLKFDWATNARVHFVFDGRHPAGASHHQKLVVVDGTIGFAGGIDLCDERWDDRRHALHNAERVTVRGRPQKPYHDMMAYCTGPVVADLTELFRTRWQRATGSELALPQPDAAVALPELASALPIAQACEVGVSVTFGAHEPSGTPQTEQIKQLYEDAIARAERLIYIETQYFTSHAVHDALCRRMRQGGGSLEIVLVMPQGADTPKEKFALGDAQSWVLSSLCATAREHGHALRVLYSAAPDETGAEVPTFIHSKLLAVDDRLLTIGSANVTNRSMSLDSELNLVWECASDDDGLARSIARLRASLLCEHAGIELDPTLERTQGLCARLDQLIGATKLRLRDLPDSPADVERSPLLERAFDPDTPLDQLELDDLIEPLREARAHPT